MQSEPKTRLRCIYEDDYITCRNSPNQNTYCWSIHKETKKSLELEYGKNKILLNLN